jgi:16S rRNA (uracil1498-N3)-methyltransferase
MAKIRLFVDHPLGAAQTVPANRDQSNYLFAVMRLSVGDEVLLFNGVDGEWRAEITVGNKRNSVLTCHAQTKPLQLPPDLWLMFAPIKKTRTDFIVEKATEMGAARIIPVLTTYTNSDRMKQERLQAHALEAAEQCGGTFVPEVTDVQKLSTVLDTWPQDRQLMFCDETLVGETGQLPDIKGPWAIVIGPEGGFSDEERTRLRNMKNAHSVALGPRILRADTAAVAALTLWQQKLGDWT